MHEPEPPADPDAERDIEAPEADVAEQHSEITRGDGDRDPGPESVDLPDDADPADVSEQAREVGYDEDDYR